MKICINSEFTKQYRKKSIDMVHQEMVNEKRKTNG